VKRPKVIDGVIVDPEDRIMVRRRPLNLPVRSPDHYNWNFRLDVTQATMLGFLRGTIRDRHQDIKAMSFRFRGRPAKEEDTCSLTDASVNLDDPLEVTDVRLVLIPFEVRLEGTPLAIKLPLDDVTCGEAKYGIKKYLKDRQS
jgi:hypothetical protein